MNARITLAVISLVLATSAAQAKPLSRIIAEMGLTPADFEVVSANSNELLASGPSTGKERSWVNAETGSKGVIRIGAVQDNCVILQHFVEPAGENAREIRTRRCNDGNGNWILSP
ncbi:MULTISPECIES: hypothetical protein [unclassified Ruegeria]|uniref:hypothetical protein n=1 Tax=unclassified Ruegeria TaxID=2625375 RepID=UPI0014897DD3|nr:MULTISPECIES: hypothetical protein [unclassified Ruegeria]